MFAINFCYFITTFVGFAKVNKQNYITRARLEVCYKAEIYECFKENHIKRPPVVKQSKLCICHINKQIYLLTYIKENEYQAKLC